MLMMMSIIIAMPMFRATKSSESGSLVTIQPWEHLFAGIINNINLNLNNININININIKILPYLAILSGSQPASPQ